MKQWMLLRLGRLTLALGVAALAALPVLPAGATEAAPAPPTDLLVSSFRTNCVMCYDGATGAFVKVLIPPDPALNGGLTGPEGLAIGPDGNLYVSSLNFDVPHNLEYPGAVLRYDGKTGTFIDSFVPPDPDRNGGLQRTAGLAFGPDGDLYVSSGDLMPKGSVLRDAGKTGAFKSIFVAPGKPDEPFGLAFGPDGSLYVGMAGGTARGATGDGSVMRYDSASGALKDAFMPADAAKNGGLTGSTFLIVVPRSSP